MDRDALMAQAPDGHTFNTLPPINRRDETARFIGSMLDAYRREFVEPDAWEGSDLAGAIAYLAMGWYNAAITLAVRSLTPPEGRGNEVTPLEGDFTLHTLTRRFDEARAQPAR